MWHPRSKDLKQYPHFDAPLTPVEIERIANNPTEIVRNAFFPLIAFENEWQPYRKSPRPERKTRELRYSAHRDAAIYARYRAELSERYEEYLRINSLSDFVIGYRQIPDKDGGGKSNIHFARDAFNFIDSNSTCTVVIADISSFFESIDHTLLLARWATILGCPRLPPDHYAIFRQTTRYRVIKRDELYISLGLAAASDNGRLVFNQPRSQASKQISGMDDFRFLFSASNPNKISVYKHRLDYGIPQGLPISDILANIYMIEFDSVIGSWCRNRGGFYQRYSDDIICVIPGDNPDLATEVISKLKSEVSKNGSELQIKDSKVASGTYRRDSRGRMGFRIATGRSRNGIEYLGFRYDGTRVYIRDKTMSNLNRKFKRRIRGSAAAYVRRYRDKSDTWLQANFDVNRAVASFLRKENFHTERDPRGWTFWTYARRSESVLKNLNPRIFQQLAGFKDRAAPFVRATLNEAIAKR